MLEVLPVALLLGVPDEVEEVVPEGVGVDAAVQEVVAVEVVAVEDGVPVELAVSVAVADGVHGRMPLRYSGIIAAAAALSHDVPRRTPELAKLLGISCVTLAMRMHIVCAENARSLASSA